MPSGRVHLRIELIGLALWITVACLLRSAGWTETSTVVAFSLAYITSMILLSPDLDLTDSHATRRWGPLRFVWWPYAVLFKHRKLSHHLLLGPATRIAYLSMVVLAVSLLFVTATRRSLHISYPPATLVLSLLAGLYLPNATHILADRLHTAWRRRP